MSASREKKLRQEQAAAGMVDPKTAREAAQRKAERKSRALYLTIAIVFVAVAAGLFVWKSGIIQKNITAVTVDGEKYTAADVSFHAYSIYSSYYNYCKTYYGDGSYVSYFLSADSLKENAVQQLTEMATLYKAAMDAGYTLTEEDQASIDAAVENLENSAAANGYSKSAYLKAMYGNTMTEKAFLRELKMTTIASSYAKQVQNGFSYSVDDLSKYYNENANQFRYCDYEQLFISSAPESKTDSDGQAIEATEEEIAAAKQAASDLADTVLDRVQKGEALETVAKDYDGKGSYTHPSSAAYSDTAPLNWLFDNSRKDGDATVIAVEDSGYYVLLFHSCQRNDYNTVDVRHILIPVDSSSLDSTSETYESDLAKLRSDALQEATDLLNQWKDGEATEASFGALADEHSSDSAEGGLYTQVYKGQMVSEFEDWCFDPARKSGDVDIVFSENYGYHIMYFVGENTPYWQLQVESALRSKDYNSWYDALTENQEVTQGSGMKYMVSLL